MAEQAVQDLIARIFTDAWAHKDGQEFGSAFVEDATYTNILGITLHGRQAIAQQHQHMFDTMYRGTQTEYEIEAVRLITEDVASVTGRALLKTADGSVFMVRRPDGMLHARAHTHFEGIALKRGDEWLLVSMHNLLIFEPQPEPTA